MFPAWREQHWTKPEIQGQNARCSMVWNSLRCVTLQKPDESFVGEGITTFAGSPCFT